MQYLIPTQSPYLLTAADIRADLGLESRDFDRLIGAAIVAVSIDIETRRQVCLHRQVWAVQRPDGMTDAAFDAAVARIGARPRIGPAYRRDDNPGDALGPYHDCTFEPEAALLGAARAAVVAWCLDQHDLCRAIGEERRNAHVALPAAVFASEAAA
ncbi:MAG TPA: hypothetical protein VGM83_16105 [Devosiaceae bacterium]